MEGSKENEPQSLNGNTNDSVYQNDKCLGESRNRPRDPHCLDIDKREVYQTLDSSFLEPFIKKRGKNAKRDKKVKRGQNSECVDGTPEVFRGTKEKRLKTLKAIPKSQSTENPFCSHLLLDSNGKGGQKALSQKETPGLFQMPCESELGSPSSFRGSAIKGFQPTRKLHQGVLHEASITEISSCVSTEYPLSSTPRPLPIKTCDSGEELDMRDREANRPSQMSSDPEATNSGIESRERFVTHSSFLPFHPPNHTVLEGSYINSSISNTPDFSQALGAKEMFESSFLLTSCSPILSNRGEHFPATRECGIQTDDFLSFSAVDSSFIIKKETIDCREQPLDLSLPYRIRSGAASAGIFHSSEVADDGIPRCKLETAIKVLGDESENLMGSESQKSADLKYIQTYLNSSYYFKLKGDPDATVSGSPLVKRRHPDVMGSGTPLGRLTWGTRKGEKNNRS